jgi:hypothetical protein
MGRRILNRKDLRDQFDAAERRKGDDEEVEEEGDEEEEDEEAEASEEEGAEEGEEVEAEAEADEEEVPVKKKPKKKAAPKEPKPKRTRTAKIVRQRVVWGVFNNSNQRVATYPYPEKTKAEEHAARLKAESKTNQTHFVQPVKEPIEDKEK